MNGDLISRLPTNNSTQPNNDEVALANHIFGVADSQVNRKAVSNYMRSPLIVAVIVGFLLHPISDTLINKIYPSAEDNKYTTMAIKMVVAAILFAVLNNWGLVRT